MTPSESKQTYVVFDTMVYLHCHQIQDIDLASLVGVPRVTLIVPRIILQELDKHKNTHQSQKIRDRSAERLKTIKSSLATSGHTLRTGVSIEVLGRRPSENAKKHGLDIEWPDDQLIASILEIKEAHPQDDVILISHDTGPQLTALQLGITVIEMPQSYRIPPEEDPLVNENKRLHREILRLQNARPDIIIRLGEMQDDENFVSFRLSRPESLNNPSKSEILAKVRDSYPNRQPPAAKTFHADDVTHISALLSLGLFDQISQSEYERYNKELSKFFSDYERYLDKLAIHNAKHDRAITLNIEVRNIGNTPAEDVDIYIHFPDGFSLYSENDLPKIPREPRPPIEPQTESQKILSYAHSSFDIPSSFHIPDSLTRDTFSLERTKSYNLNQHFDRIKHGHLMKIRPIFLVFDSFDQAQSFGFEYNVTAGNIPDRIAGRLNVSIQKDG